MLVTTQWPLKRAATSPHLSGFVFYGCLESLTELSALWNILLSAQGRFKNIAFQDRGTILQEEVLKKHLWVKWVWKWQFWNYIQILTGPVSSDLTQHSVIFCQKSRHFYSKKFRSSYHSGIHGVGINGVTTLLVWKIIIVGESCECRGWWCPGSFSNQISSSPGPTFTNMV